MPCSKVAFGRRRGEFSSGDMLARFASGDMLARFANFHVIRAVDDWPPCELVPSGSLEQWDTFQTLRVFRHPVSGFPSPPPNEPVVTFSSPQCVTLTFRGTLECGAGSRHTVQKTINIEYSKKVDLVRKTSSLRSRPGLWMALLHLRLR